MITIAEVGPTRSNFAISDVQHSTSGRILSLALSADPNRVYAGSFAGVWRSDDAGQTFRQLTGPLSDTAGPGIFGGVYAPHIFDLAASPADPDLILAAARDGRFVTNRDGIYRSADGGQSWELALPVPTLQFSGSDNGISQILFAPDDSNLMYAALGIEGVGISTNAGKTWNTKLIGNNNKIWHIAIAPQEGPGVRKIYAAGDSNIFFSPDGGDHWFVDNGVSTINATRTFLKDFQKNFCGSPNFVGGFGGLSARNSGSCPQTLAVEPGNPAKVYLATEGGAFGPCYYHSDVADGVLVNTRCARLADEGSLWYGDFSQFDATRSAQWTQLSSPPVYSGGGDTPSGNMYVITKPTSSGFLVFFSDMSHVHVSQGTPSSFNSWHRLGGKDASEAKRDGDNSNIIRVHADPHALLFTSDFEITLKPASGVSDPYNRNAELDQYIAGIIWMANDGGVCMSQDGGRKWNLCGGLETLDPINIAGLFGTGNAPALYFGCGDNDDFFTHNGGQTWGDPISSCGDCDAWFADEAQSDRVLQFEPRHWDNNLNAYVPGVNIILSDDPSQYPDAADSSSTHYVHSPLRTNRKAYPESDLVLRGYRPLIRTLSTEYPLHDGDYVFIHSGDGMTRKVLRTTSIRSITQVGDWDDATKAQPIGTPLPGNSTDPEPVVQASGGHSSPVFYVGYASGVLRKWDDRTGLWKVIVPGGPTGRAATGAISFFVDPFHPEIIYLVDQSGIKVSLDGGDSWLPELGLAQAVTAGGKIVRNSATVVSDMLFSPDEPFTRFAFGDAGVFYTINGVDWITLLDAIAIPGRPISGFFDPVSDPADRALYVVLEGRSVLRLGGILAPPPLQPPPVYDLLEFAAILEA